MLRFLQLSLKIKISLMKLKVSVHVRQMDISIRMLKTSESAIVKPLTVLFKNCIGQGIFPDDWKKSNICSNHQKDDKQIVNNYRPLPLLPICEKNI